jgi:alkylation response protein AidB-like acyl-CoA dehydrogenase
MSSSSSPLAPSEHYEGLRAGDVAGAPEAVDLYRDAKVIEIYGGTSKIQQLVITGALA